MQSIKINIIHPKARKLLTDMAEMGLIHISDSMPQEIEDEEVLKKELLERDRSEDFVAFEQMVSELKTKYGK